MGVTTLRNWLWTYRLSRQGAVLQKLDDLRSWSSLDRPGSDALQRERLEALLRWANDHVPYYRTIFGHYGVLRRGAVDMERFRELPLLDKATIRSRGPELHADDVHHREYRVNTSGGSTGEPVRLIQDRGYQEWNSATTLLFNEWTGFRPGEPSVYLWGAPRDVAKYSTIRGQLGRWFRNEVLLDAFHMPRGRKYEYVRRINSVRPGLIVAYAQSLYELAQFIESEGIDVWSPGAVITSATTLDEHMRQTIERVFHARVFNRYGSREVGGVACDHPSGGGLAISAPTHFVEVLRPDGSVAPDGEMGEIVITLLTNQAMPLVRYRIGDVGVRGPKAHDIGWPILSQVAGRVTDIFPTASGGYVYGGYFTQLFYRQEWVREFQVIQEELEHIRVAVVPSVPPVDVPAGALESVTGAIRRVMGADCRIDLEFVESIDRPPSGKRRYTVSRVAKPLSATVAPGVR